MAQQSYFDLASELAESAPSQAQLLRYLLVQQEMSDGDQICEDLGISRPNFNVLLGKLRDRGVEVVTKRTHAPEDRSKDVRYVYGIATSEVENWSTDRRKAVLTAWERTTRVFERHLLDLDLPRSEVYKILGVMEYVTKTLQDIDLGVSVQAEAKAKADAEAAAVEVEAAAS